MLYGVRTVWRRPGLDSQFTYRSCCVWFLQKSLVSAEPKSVRKPSLVSGDIEKCALLIVPGLSSAKAFLEPFSDLSA